MAGTIRSNLSWIPLNHHNNVSCLTSPVRYKKSRETLNGLSSKILAYRLHELEKGHILKRRSYNGIPPRVEYRLTAKAQELVESIMNLLQWMRKWSTVPMD